MIGYRIEQDLGHPSFPLFPNEMFENFLYYFETKKKKLFLVNVLIFYLNKEFEFHSIFYNNKKKQKEAKEFDGQEIF